MDSWQFKITREAQFDLSGLDISVKNRISEKLNWLLKNFDYVTPLPLGEPLKGFFKLRVGDWRIVYEVEYDRKLVIIHAIGRRDKIYKTLLAGKK